MEWYFYVLIIFGSLIIIISILFPFILSYLLCVIHMKRTSKKKWTRACSFPKNAEQLEMWNRGLEYIKQYQDKIEEVDINSDGLHLFGEYVNVESDRCVILLGGRCECLYYAYYYAKPYLENNVNVLVVDQRAHGNSDGVFSTVGIKESQDMIEWIKFLQEKKNIKKVLMHGTCIGAATIIHTVTDPKCPNCIDRIIVDGLFRTYYETFKLHMEDLKKPTKTALPLTFKWYKRLAKIDAKNNGPIYLIDKVSCPIMFLSSKEDKFVFPYMIDEMYEKCQSKQKECHFLDKGGHSHIRINQEELYDKYVIDFLK